MRDSPTMHSAAARGTTPLRRVTAADLATLVHRSATVVLDVRPSWAYNGWRTGDAARGGHIPGAISVPASWFDPPGSDELRLALDDRRLGPGRRVVLCADEEADLPAIAGALEQRGVAAVRVLDGGLAAWADEPGRQVDRLARHDRLVHAAWLVAALAGERPEATPSDLPVVLHANAGLPEEYEDGHIPGALHLDTNRLEDPVTWDRRRPAELRAELRALGLRCSTPVVLYGRSRQVAARDRQSRRSGPLAAMRALSILHYAGIADVRLLDGGFDAWVRHGGPVETGRREPVPGPAFGGSVPGHPESIVDIETAREILADPEGSALVGVRTWPEVVGEDSGYDYIERAGRIPGDVWDGLGATARRAAAYRNEDDTMRAYPEIAADWAAAGITPDKRIAFYCGTGWRASEAWFAAYLQGWPRISVYDGGWFGWSRDPANPIDRGAPPGAG